MNGLLSKRAVVIAIALLAASALIIGAVAAQGPGQGGPLPPPAGGWMRGPGGALADLVQEYTGLDAAELRAALRSGATVAELIEANGKSVDDFIAAATAWHDALLAERSAAFEETLTALLNGEYPVRLDAARRFEQRMERLQQRMDAVQERLGRIQGQMGRPDRGRVRPPARGGS